MNPSNWITRWGEQLPPGASVLDLACGSGRHVHWWAARGARVTAVDRDALALEPLRKLAEVIVADIEDGPWPLQDRRFDVVMVTNYLWQPLLPHIVAAVAPGGWLLYETFGIEQATIGRPSRPEFLLKPGELIDAVRPELRVVGYEDGWLPQPDRYVQRIAARRGAPGTTLPR